MLVVSVGYTECKKVNESMHFENEKVGCFKEIFLVNKMGELGYKR